MTTEESPLPNLLMLKSSGRVITLSTRRIDRGYQDDLTLATRPLNRHYFVCDWSDSVYSETRLLIVETRREHADNRMTRNMP